jgi:hypothetical protein
MHTNILTQSRLKELLHLSDNEVFTHKITASNRVKLGSFAGTITGHGYRVISLDRKRYYGHRLLWLWHYGEFPKGQIDHINHNRLDNRLDNLRAVSNQDNHRNETLSTNSLSGFTGVCFSTREQKFRAHIKVDFKQIHLGHFKQLSDAVLARINAEEKYGFHKNHGR